MMRDICLEEMSETTTDLLIIRYEEDHPLTDSGSLSSDDMPDAWVSPGLVTSIVWGS